MKYAFLFKIANYDEYEEGMIVDREPLGAGAEPGFRAKGSVILL